MEIRSDEDLKNLAIYLHETYCRWNHADGCSWHYEIDRVGEDSVHDWGRFAHKEYMDKAKNLIAWMNARKSPAQI